MLQLNKQRVSEIYEQVRRKDSMPTKSGVVISDEGAESLMDGAGGPKLRGSDKELRIKS